MLERVRIIGIAPWHTLQAQEVHREEHHVHADEEDPEMELAEELVVHLARHLREPVIEAGEEAEHRAEAEHVVEMRHHVIGILHVIVDAAVGERSEEHTSELQSLMRISYAVFCLKT